MITKDEAFAHVEVLLQYANGAATKEAAETALRLLDTIPQVNVGENVVRFRGSMKLRGLRGGMDKHGWMVRDAMGIQSALENFVYGDED